MSEEEKTILLTFNRRDFEELYHLREYGNLFSNRNTRSYLLIVIAVALVFIISICYSIFFNRLIVMSVMSFLGLSFSLVLLHFIARPYRKWKKSIVDWIDSMEMYTSQKLILTTNSVVLVQDEIETMEKWTGILNVKIAPNYVAIKGSEQFIFPKASMTEKDFEYLSSVVSRLMKSGL